MLKKLILIIFPGCAFATVSNGPYVGIEAGVSNQIMIFNGNTSENTTSNNSYNTSLGGIVRLNLGYTLNRYSSFELGGNYTFSNSFVSPIGSTFSLNNTSTDFSYLLNLPTTFNGVSVFGRIGAAYDWINSNSCNCNGGGVSGSNLTDALGAGVRYNLTSNTSFRVEWLENGLIFPIGISSGSQNVASWTNQMFLAGINLSF